MFVGHDGEITVAVDVLCSASTVWRERLRMADISSEAPRSEEPFAVEELKAFARVISIHSQDAEGRMDEIPLDTLVLALPLIHKYDCTGTKLMLDQLDCVHFPNVGEAKLKSSIFSNSINNYIISAEMVVAEGSNFYVTQEWLTQKHLDYLVLKQELFGEGNHFPENINKLFGALLTRKIISHTVLSCGTMSFGFAGVSNPRLTNLNSILVNVEMASPAVISRKRKSTSELPESETNQDAAMVEGGKEPLTVEGWRITAATFAAIIPYMQPAFA